MIRRQPPLWRILLMAMAVVALDLWSKHWVMRSMALGESRAVAPFFYLTHVHNTGSAFGLFQGNNHALLIVALVILGVLFYSARGLYEQGGWWGEIGVALIVGGAVGNLIDRFQYGYVVDFLDFRVWPVFNVADSAITVGAISLVLGLSLRRADA